MEKYQRSHVTGVAAEARASVGYETGWGDGDEGRIKKKEMEKIGEKRRNIDNAFRTQRSRRRYSRFFWKFHEVRADRGKLFIRSERFAFLRQA